MSEHDHPESGHSRRRFDFSIEVIASDKESGSFTLRLRPNPDRYEWRLVDGERLLFDRMDDVYFPANVLDQLISGIKKMPMNFEPPMIDSAANYVAGRLDSIRKHLNGEFPTPTHADPSNETLQILENEALNFVILSLDLVGSTKLATTMTPERYVRAIRAALFEVSRIVPLFHGNVLKYTGDGIIAYFPSPSFITKNDLALDCALTLKRLVHEGLNPVFSSSNFPELDVRIGIDSGQAAVVALGNPATKQHADIIGAVVSLACKIQSRADNGGIAVGDLTLRNLHTDWRLSFEELEMADWNYADPESGEAYRVHRFRFAKKPSTE